MSWIYARYTRLIFDIDAYIESGALGFRVDFSQPTRHVDLELVMHEMDALYFTESQLSKEQKIEKLSNNLYKVSANVPFTSQLTWWLRSFGQKLIRIEPIEVFNAVHEIDQQTAD